jgi:hypothetical protein
VTDEAFLDALERCTLPEPAFDHPGHVRAGYLVLRQHGFPGALLRMRELIRAYARSLGKPDRYHETITAAFLVLIHGAMRGRPADDDWRTFSRDHPELLDKTYLSRYYRDEVLAAPEAREVFVLNPRA